MPAPLHCVWGGYISENWVCHLAVSCSYGPSGLGLLIAQHRLQCFLDNVFWAGDVSPPSFLSNNTHTFIFDLKNGRHNIIHLVSCMATFSLMSDRLSFFKCIQPNIEQGSTCIPERDIADMFDASRDSRWLRSPAVLYSYHESNLVQSHRYPDQ